MMRTQIMLFDGFDALDVVAPYEVLSAGGAFAGGALAVELVSAEGPREVPSGAGPLSFRATATADPREADLLVVPGAGGGSDDEITGNLATAAKTALPEVARAALEEPGTTVATVCGGSLLLAMAGLLTGRHAVTHHDGMAPLEALGVTTVDARVVDDGDLVTSGAVTSGLDLALYLLERELGPHIAQAVERYFAHERRGTVWRAISLTPQGKAT
jgi:transcriptional regulator GlxA family with amidase domain